MLYYIALICIEHTLVIAIIAAGELMYAFVKRYTRYVILQMEDTIGLSNQHQVSSVIIMAAWSLGSGIGRCYVVGGLRLWHTIVGVVG